MDDFTTPAADAAIDSDAPFPAFAPVAMRPRNPGWSPARQVAFVQALADSGCVEEAARRVGLSASSAYALRRRPDAASFREAWDVALDYAISRLGDAAFSRALNGVATPVFYQGEQIGERRRYDERLTMFLLRYRDPARYGAWLDDMAAKRNHPDGAAINLARSLSRVAQDATEAAAGRKPPRRAPILRVVLDDDPAVAEAEAEARERADAARREAEWQAYLETLGEGRGEDFNGDVP